MRFSIIFFISVIVIQSVIGSSNNTYQENLIKLDSLAKHHLNVDSTILYYQKYIDVAATKKDTVKLAYGYMKLGWSFLDKSQYEEAKGAVKKHIHLTSKMDNKVQFLKGIKLLGVIYNKQKQRTKALETYFDGIDILDHLPEDSIFKDLRSRFYNNIAVVYTLQEKYQEAKNFYLKSKTYIGPRNPSILYNNLGDIEMRLDNLIAAEEYLTLAAATVDSADIGLSLVIKSSFTELYTKKGQNQKALSYAYDYTYLASKNGFTEKALYGRQLIDTILNGLNLQDQVLFEKIDYKKNKDIETQTDFQSIKERGLRNFIDILLILIVLFLGYRLVKTKK